MRRLLALLVVAVLLTVGAATYFVRKPKLKHPRELLAIVYPMEGTVFPPDIAAPAFRWIGADANVVTWHAEVAFEDGKPPLKTAANASPWTPTERQWQTIKSRSVSGAARVTIAGLRDDGCEALCGSVSIRTAKEPVGSPLFYREVPLPFSDAVKDPSRIRWRFGSVSSATQPPIVLDNLPVCGNCHSFSADGRQFGMDIDYANDKGSYVMSAIEPETVLDPSKIITWSDYRRDDAEPTFGLLSQISPDGRYVISTVKDRSVFVPRPNLEFSQLFFPIKGILAVYDRQTKRFFPLPGTDDPQYVQSNPTWSPDGNHIVFARARSHELKGITDSSQVLLSAKECEEFLDGGKTFQFDLYRVAFNGGKGGQAVPVAGASDNGVSNYFPKYSPDGRWIVFCKSASFMLLQPDSELYIIPAEGGAARRLECNTRRMNSWHTWSPNSRWLAFTSKANGPYSQIFLTQIDETGHSSPPVELAHFTAADRAANIPEFVNAPPTALTKIVEQFVNDLSHVRAGNAYFKAKDWQCAERMYRKALEINPDCVDALNNLSGVLAILGQADEAIAHYRKVLEIKPDDDLAHYMLGIALANRGQVDEAIVHYRKVLEIKPDHAEAHNNLGADLANHGQIDEAIAHFQKALKTNPDYSGARRNLDIARSQQERILTSLAQRRALLRTRPKDVILLNDIAWFLATAPNASTRNGAEAVELAQQAVELSDGKRPEILDTLAAAYAEAGRFAEAVQTAHKAVDLAKQESKQALAESLHAKILLYEANTPFRELPSSRP